MVNHDDLHFVIRVRGKGGTPIHYQVLMNRLNKLYIRMSRDLPKVTLNSQESIRAGSHILDMTKFSRVEIYQVVDSVPALKEVGSTILGTIYQTKMRAWDLIDQTEREVDLTTKNEAHLLFNIDYRQDTVNLISLYNHTHEDEVVAMIIKKGTEAKILLFDFKLEAIDLDRRSGRSAFIDFIRNFRESFVHFAERNHPDGQVTRIAPKWRQYSEQVIFDIPEGLTYANKNHVQDLLKELYGLKLILAASLIDRCPKNSPEYKMAERHLNKYLPRATTEKRFLNFGEPQVTWSRVVFGLPQFNDLFDKMPNEPARLQGKTKDSSGDVEIVLRKDELSQIPNEFRDFWHVVKIDPD
ncbi:MAG: hypothetical protein AAF902_03355 [Chloroflexota bacterium]